MKSVSLIFSFALLASTAAAHEQTVPGPATDSAAANQDAQAPVAEPVSRSPVDVVRRTGLVARQQAEAEVHFETRRQVQKAFDGLFRRLGTRR